MKTSSLITLLSVLTGISALEYPDLQDGLYKGIIHPNGSTTIHSLDDPSAAPVMIPGSSSMSTGPKLTRGLQKRKVSCWGSALDHSGIDAAAQRLRDWANIPGGHELKSTAQSNVWVSAINEGMQVYYCINAKSSSGNLDLNDVNYALSQMDRYCDRYTASYYQWDGTPEIVGKCAASVPVCKG